MQRAVLLRGGEQQRPRSVVFVRRDPVLGHYFGRRGVVGETLRRSNVMTATPSPGNPSVERLPHQRVPEHRHFRPRHGLFDEKPRVQQLVDIVRRNQLGQHRQLNPHPEHRGEFHGLQMRGAQVRRPGQYGVHHALGQRNARVCGHLQPAVALPQRSGLGQRRGQLLDDERQPVRSAVDLGEQPRGDGPAEQACEKLAGLLLGERTQRDLGQPTAAPQFGASTPQGVRPRQLIAAIGRHDQHRLTFDRDRQRGQDVQRCRVGPMQVLEDDHRRSITCHQAKDPSQGVGKGRAVVFRVQRAVSGRQRTQATAHIGVRDLIAHRQQHLP